MHDFVLMPPHHQALRRGKGPVAAEPVAAAVGGYDSEMINGVRT